MTEREEQVAQKVLECGGCREAARQLGLSHQRVSYIMRRWNRYHSANGTPVPHGMQISHSTITIKEDGSIGTEWVRTKPELQAIEAFVDALAERVEGGSRVPRYRRTRKAKETGLLYEIGIYDPHIGMYAWGEETRGGDYDCKVAGDRVRAAVVDLADQAAGRDLDMIQFTLGGDILHIDNTDGVSRKSGHSFDVDTRFDHVIDHAIAACVDAIDIVATLAPVVNVVSVPGNHDPESGKWLQRVLTAYYQNDPRIQINQQKSDRKSLVWGNNLLTWAHGEKVPMNKWPSIIAAEFAQEWGQTGFRHHKMGHIHHEKGKRVDFECFPGLLVEYVEALCRTDAWHSGMGLLGAERGASGFLYCKERGRRARFYHRAD